MVFLRRPRSLWFGLCIALIPHLRSFAQIFALNAFLGAIGALALPAANALVVEEGRRFGMGALMGIFNLSMSLGLAVGPILGGVIADRWGLPAIIYFASLAGLSGATAFAGFSRRQEDPFPLTVPWRKSGDERIFDTCCGANLRSPQDPT